MTEAAVLCVYYKAHATQHATLAARVRRFQVHLLAAWPGLVCELLQRPEATDGVETWMETYRDNQGQDLSAALIDHIALAAAAAELLVPRHNERLMALR